MPGRPEAVAWVRRAGCLTRHTWPKNGSIGVSTARRQHEFTCDSRELSSFFQGRASSSSRAPYSGFRPGGQRPGRLRGLGNLGSGSPFCLLRPASFIAGWTTRLFVDKGEGTPAPWDPPTKLVVVGPYRHVRNPMITGVFLMLTAESVLFGSWPLFGWVVVFFLLNTVYFSKVEEPGLERRFGENYRHYRSNVPRWIPRWRQWNDS